MMKMKATFIMMVAMLSLPLLAQDNTNPYCAPGNVPTYPGGVTTDGPATLPQRCMFTQESSTPSSNYPKYVGPTASLMAVLATAQPGDSIVVDPANITTVTGKYQLPSGICSTGQYITLKSSAMAMLPDEFTRVSPSFAQYMPKMVIANQSASALIGSCFRWEGYEITRPSGSGIVYNLLLPGLGSDGLPAHDYILDRVYVHGTVGDETNRGVMLNNTYNVGIINSYFSDFHCFASVGMCGDSQAVSGGGSTTPDGNFKVVNSYLEAAGENVLFGGSPATTVVSDLVVMYNTIAKPPSWNPMDPTYSPATARDGKQHPWIVKNNFELKNGARVLFEGNRLQYTWGGFTQIGAAILLTAKNQAGAVSGNNQCPICAVTDVTVRLNYGSYYGQAFQVGCDPNSWGAWPAACGNYSIHDNPMDHGQYPTCYMCGSFVVQLAGGSATVPFANVSIVNNTFSLDGWITASMTGPGLTPGPNGSNAFSFLNTGAANPTTASGWHVDNNTFDPGRFGVYSTGGGPVRNCWTADGVSIAVRVPQCWGAGSTITGNFIKQQSFFQTTYMPWPVGNTIVPPPISGPAPIPPPSTGANLTAVQAALAKAH